MRSHRAGMPHWQRAAAWSTLGVACCGLSALVASQVASQPHLAPVVTSTVDVTSTDTVPGPTETATVRLPGAQTTFTARSTTTDTATATKPGPTATRTVVRPGPTVTVTATRTVTETPTESKRP